MGAGIAQICLQKGFPVLIFDSSPDALCAASGRIKKGLDAAVARGKIAAEQASEALARIVYGKKLEDLGDCDFLIEAANENIEVKRVIIETLSRVCRTAIIATNTSSLPIAKLSEFCAAPERFLGVHFFNPPVAMKLVEMINGPKTSEETRLASWTFVEKGLSRVPVSAKDTPGFIVNRVMRPYYLECQRAALAGCSISALDGAAKQAGSPLGPFELMDLIGLDVNLSITKVIYEACGKPERFKPVSVQEKLVASGALGRKAGRGFYLYKEGKTAGENPAAAAFFTTGAGLTPEAGWERVIGSVIAEAERAFAEGVASKADIDTAVKLAMNFPKGPFEWRQKSAAK